MAKVRVRPESGRLQFDFKYQGLRCREQTSLPDTPANRRQVEDTLKRIMAEITLGSFDYARYFPNSKLLGQINALNQPKANPLPGQATIAAGQAPLFRDFANSWFGRFEVSWRQNNRETVRGHLDYHLVPKFGDFPVNEITRDQVLDFRAALAKVEAKRRKRPLAPKSVNHIMGVLGAVMAEASRSHHFVNPCAGIKRLKVPRQDINPFSLDEITRIIETVRQDYKEYMTIRFFTAMRTGELHGLKWEYVDFVRRQILVRETWTHGRTEYTKTDGSQREIDMSQRVFDALKVQEKATRHRSEYVFCNSVGGPLDTKNFTDRVWYPLLRLLELKPRRPYQTRHTCATLWLGAGENPQWVARQMGHSSTEILFRVYARFIPNLTRQDGSAFERLLQNSNSEKTGGDENV